MQAHSPSEEKTKCKHCGAAILVMTAERTGGYCMPHRYLGFSFEDRAPACLNLGNKVTLAFAREEFTRTRALRDDPRDGDSEERLAIFTAAFQPGDTVQEFVGEPRDDVLPFYPSRGFVVVRRGAIIQGVVIESKLNPDYGPAEADMLAGMVGLEDPVEIRKLAAELEKDARAERVPDYWGRRV